MHKLQNSPLHYASAPILPWCGALAGIIAGQHFAHLSQVLSAIAAIITSLIEMCTIPILFTAVSVSISKVCSIRHGFGYLRIISIYMGLAWLLSLVGVGIIFMLKPGFLVDTRYNMDNFAYNVFALDRSLHEPIESYLQLNIAQSLKNLIPSNAFLSIAEDKFFQLIAFAMGFGIALSRIDQDKQNVLVGTLDFMREIFEKIYHYVLRFIPIGIFCVMARCSSNSTTEFFIEMVPFISSIYMILIILFVLGLIFISRRLQCSVWKVVKLFQQPIFVSLATDSGIASIPLVIRILTTSCQLDKHTTQVLAPAGLVAIEFGMVIYLPCLAMFIAQYYEHGLAQDFVGHFSSFLLLIVSAPFAAWTAIGSVLEALDVLLGQLDLSADAFHVLLDVIDYLVFPVRNVLTVQFNIVAMLLAVRIKDPRPS